MNWLKAYNHEGTEKVYIDGQRRQISMAGREDWIINGFQFGSEKDVNQAKSEKLKIQKLEEKMDYENPQMVLMVYKKAIENRIFKTPIGYEYLKELQKTIGKNSRLQKEIPPIPVNQVYHLRDSTAPVVEKVKASQKPKKPKKEKQEFFTRKTSIIWNIILAILVIVMFYISTTGSKPTVLNYEKALQNRYAQWEQELEQRESELREKEKAFLSEQ